MHKYIDIEVSTKYRDTIMCEIYIWKIIELIKVKL